MPSEVGADYSRQKGTIQLECVEDEKEEDRQSGSLLCQTGFSRVTSE